MNLSDVSRTAILTLIVHVIMAERKMIYDPMAMLCLDNMLSLATEEEKLQIKKTKGILKGIGKSDAEPMIQRVMMMDKIANDYIAKNPNCTVINLASGFDTRYWRIDNKNCKYIEIDLPEVVALKKELLEEKTDFEIYGSSVLDYTWIKKVTMRGNGNFILIAEGLFMYLSEQEVKDFLKEISEGFKNSQIVFDMFPKYLTNGFWKLMTKWNSRILIGMNISNESGYIKTKEIEDYGFGFRIDGIKKLGRGLTVINSSINNSFNPI